MDCVRRGKDKEGFASDRHYQKAKKSSKVKLVLGGGPDVAKITESSEATKFEVDDLPIEEALWSHSYARCGDSGGPDSRGDRGGGGGYRHGGGGKAVNEKIILANPTIERT